MDILKISVTTIVIILLGYFCQSFAHISDDFRQTTVRGYRRMCPYTNLCSIPKTQNFSDNTDGIFDPVPCCSPCNCSDDCDTECCPDKLNYYPNMTHINNHSDKETCVTLQRKQFYDEEVIGASAIYMQATCPSEYKNLDIIAKCEQNYIDFGFKDDISYFGPVSNCNITFKNRYCALCNGVKDFDSWTMGVACKGVKTVPSFRSLSELILVTNNNKECDLFFYQINFTSNIRFCSPVIRTCNITGQWDHFNSDLEQACLSYTSIYKDIYKNVHCFLCNKPSNVSIDMSCVRGLGISSYVALLDFKGLEASKYKNTKSDNCRNGYVYDNLKNECQALLCPDFMFVDQDRCTSLLLNVTQTRNKCYDIMVSIEPLNYTETDMSFDTLYHNIWNYVTRELMSYSQSLVLGNLSGFIVFNKKIEDIIQVLVSNPKQYRVNSDIKYVILRLIVNDNRNETVEDEFKVFDDLFRTYNSTAHSVRFRNIPVDIFDNASLSLRSYLLTGNFDRDSMLNNLSLGNKLHDALGSGLYNSEHDLKIGPLPMLENNSSCTPNAVYQVKRFCPKLLISPNEIDILKDGINLKQLDLFLPNQEIIFTSNDHVLICFKPYIESVMRNHVNESILPNITIEVFSLSLSVICLSVIFCIYCLFKKLKSLPGLNILGLVAWLFLSHFLTLLTVVVKFKDRVLCISFGIALHFSLLMSIVWMFVCTFHMAKVFSSLERVDTHNSEKNKVFIRYNCFTLFMSAIFVVCNIITSVIGSKGDNIGYDSQECYIKSRDMVLYTVAVPIGLVVVLNISMFLYVIIKFSRIPNMKDCRNKERNDLVIFLKLSTLTGMSYIFGFVYEFSEIAAFSYIFVILTASQGVFLFIAFVLNRRVLDMIKNSFQSEEK